MAAGAEQLAHLGRHHLAGVCQSGGSFLATTTTVATATIGDSGGGCGSGGVERGRYREERVVGLYFPQLVVDVGLYDGHQFVLEEPLHGAQHHTHRHLRGGEGGVDNVN